MRKLLLICLCLAYNGHSVVSDELLRVVIVSRHGIKNPLNDEMSLKLDHKKIDFGVPYGALTEHGGEVLENLGAWLSMYYANRRLGLKSCDGKQQVLILSDPSSDRDAKSTQRLMKGFKPPCGWSAGDRLGAGSVLDRIENHDPRGRKTCGMPNAILKAAIPVKELENEHSHVLPKVCTALLGRTGTAKCPLVNNEEKRLREPAPWHPFNSILADASKYVELILMQYLDGHTVQDGNLVETEDQVREILPIQQVQFSQAGLGVARNFGSELLAHMLATLLQGATPQQHVPLVPPNIRLVIHEAHDSNIQFVRELLQIHWTSFGWIRDFAAPGDMLAFELIRDNNHRHWVQLMKISLSPEQQRSNKNLELNDPSVKPVAMWACNGLTEDLRCPLEEFGQMVVNAVIPDCVKDPELRARISDLDRFVPHNKSTYFIREPTTIIRHNWVPLCICVVVAVSWCVDVQRGRGVSKLS